MSSLAMQMAPGRAEFPEHFSPVNREASRGLRLVSLAEVLTALSYALDLTGGLPPGHTVRTCIIGMRIAHTLGLSDEECSALYDAVLLKDAGSSSNASYLTALFDTDDRLIKPRLRWMDRRNRVTAGLHTMRAVGVGRSPLSRLSHFLGIVQDDLVAQKLVRIRSDHGAKIALRLGFPRATAHAIRSLDEQWNGLGLPEGRRGDEIPLLSRILAVADDPRAVDVDPGHAARGRARREDHVAPPHGRPVHLDLVR